jgi:hypothetical protein
MAPNGHAAVHALPGKATFYSWLQERMAGLRAEVVIDHEV